MCADTFNTQDVKWIQNKKDLKSFFQVMKKGQVVAFDLETTGLDEHAVRGGKSNGGYPARVVLLSATTIVSAGDNPTTWLLMLSHPQSVWLGQWRKVLRAWANRVKSQGVKLIAHNAQFDARWVYAHTGVDISRNLVWDTLISSSLLDETSSTRLKEQASTLFNIPAWDDFSLKTPGAAEHVDWQQLGYYAARDTYWTWKLFEYHYGVFHPKEIGSQLEVEDQALGVLYKHVGVPAMRTLTQLQQNGIKLDLKKVKEKIEELTPLIKELSEELTYLYGNLGDFSPSLAPTSKWFKAWTLKAIEAGDLRVVAMTEKGSNKWDKDTLNKLARSGFSVAEKLLNLRDMVKQVEFLNSWLAKTSSEGKIHATYKANGTVTGRLSSTDPNMQQVNRRLKQMFIPSEGNVFCEMDYSQVELRVAAHIAQCQPMIDAFKGGQDLHRLFASKLTGKAFDEVTSEERQKAKAANFGLLYGMGAEGFQGYAEATYGVSISLEESHELRKAFFDTWEGIAEWHDRARQEVIKQGYAVSPLGRIRRVADKVFSSNPGLVSQGVRQATNFSVQGMASDIMMLAASAISGNIKGIEPVSDARLVATVHDSVEIELPKESWKATALKCKELAETAPISEMLSKFYLEFSVPLVADLTIGTAWGLSDIYES